MSKPGQRRDIVRELFDLVEAAGGQVRLYGQLVSADELRAVGGEIVAAKITGERCPICDRAPTEPGATICALHHLERLRSGAA